MSIRYRIIAVTAILTAFSWVDNKKDLKRTDFDIIEAGSFCIFIFYYRRFDHVNRTDIESHLDFNDFRLFSVTAKGILFHFYKDLLFIF